MAGGYGKIFADIFDSSLIAIGGWLPTYIMMSMVALADKDGLVQIAPLALYRRLGFLNDDNRVSFKDFEAALRYLEEPDPESGSPDQDGKRIVPLAQVAEHEGNRGWLIVNHEHYRKKAANAEERAASTERVRRYRERKRLEEEAKQAMQQNQRDRSNVTGDVTQGNDGNGHTDTYSIEHSKENLPSEGKRKVKLPDGFTLTIEMQELALEHWNKKRRPDLDPHEQFTHFIDHHTAHGTRLIDWQAGWRTWYTKAVQFNKPPSTTTKSFDQQREESNARKFGIGKSDW